MIIVNLDVMMAKRKISSNELAEKIGITPANLSVLKTNKGKAIRFSTLNKLCKVKNHIEAVAIGEIGLDYYGDHKTEGDYKNQKEWFIAEIELAKKLNLPLVIHSRDACKDTLDMMREYAKGMTGILHCFSYEKEIAIEYIKLGFYIGVGGVVTFKNGKKLKEVVSAIPIERIVTETDAPWLTPTPYRGKRNESTYIKYVISEIANIKSIDESAAASTLYQNAIDVYNLH